MHNRLVFMASDYVQLAHAKASGSISIAAAVLFTAVLVGSCKRSRARYFLSIPALRCSLSPW